MTKALADLLKLIQKLYGKRALSKTIGTRTNVITLPDKETKRFVTSELNIEAASDAAVKKGFEDAEKLIADIPKMNDQEILTFKNNLQRMDNRINPPQAEVITFGTKEKVSPEGIKSLMQQKGQVNPPGTLMGDLESRIKQLEASGEELSKMKGQTLDDILGDVMQSQKTMSKLQDEGLVRAAVRYKMMDDLKRGTLKLPKNLEDVVRGASNEEEVITIFRNSYGEDALEQVDSLVPDFYKMTSPTEAVKKIEKDFPNIKPRKIKTKQTMELDEAAKAEQENILTPKKPEEPEEFAIGGRVGFQKGTSAIFDQLEMDVPYPKAHKDGVLALSYPRVEYAYGSGLKLIKLLKQKGTSLQKAIKKAIDNIYPTGDSKLDADRVVDDMLETYNIDRDAVDGYDILNAYDQAYKNIAREKLINRIKKVNPEVDISIDISDPETASDFAKFAKQNDPEGYKKLEKITEEINTKNKAVRKNAEKELIQARKNVGESQDFTGDDVKYDARILAEELANVRFKTDYSDLDLDSQLDLFDESYNHLLDLIQERGQIKGAVNLRTGKNILTGKQERAPEALPGEDPIKPKKRTLNASGGLAYLMGL